MVHNFLGWLENSNKEVSPRPPFDELGESWNAAKLDDELLNALLREGFVRPSASQRWAVPLLLAGKDVMVCSQTGKFRWVFNHKCRNTGYTLLEHDDYSSQEDLGYGCPTFRRKKIASRTTFIGFGTCCLYCIPSDTTLAYLGWCWF